MSEELKEIARVELGETDDVRQHAIKAMRDWIMDNPRIVKCRMDSKFILRFLRFRKFDVPKAQETLERWLVAREGAYGSDYFSSLDYSKPCIEKLLNCGFVMIFPNRDEQGRLVILSRPGAVDPKLPTVGVDGITLSLMIGEALLEDEENQIRGIVYISDYVNVTWSHYRIFSFTQWFKLAKNAEVRRAFLEFLWRNKKLRL